MYVEKFGQHVPDTSGTFTFRSVNDKDINQVWSGTDKVILTTLFKKSLCLFCSLHIFCPDERNQ